MSGTNFNKHRFSAKGDGSTGPDHYFQNSHLVPAPREDNLYGGNVGDTFTAAVTINATNYYSDEGVGGMKVCSYLHATAACEYAASTLSLTLYRVLDDSTEYIIATAQATLPKLSANGTVSDVANYVDLPFTEDQILQGNKVRVATTLTPSAAVANSLLKVDLLKTGIQFEANLATNYLSAIASYTQSSNASLTAIDANVSAIETLITTLNGYQQSANASLTAIDGNMSAIETILTSANASLTAMDANLSAIETLLTTAAASMLSASGTLVEIFSSLDTLILTATNSIRSEEIDPLDLHYDAQNLCNSASLGFTAGSTTKYYDISMDGYGALGMQITFPASAGTSSATINVFGTMDRAAAGGAEVYYNINQEIDSAASTAGWTITGGATWTLEDVSGVCGFFKKVRFALTETADFTWVVNYKLKQLL